ncbi:hypothetical protein F66182_6605 [Fusarium sp. NRRL 66182]|nr:hypothetical protein F66182_6605 [Fusarium sp. NRRL 66182]
MGSLADAEAGMDVIVIGAGYGGLSCAIELKRKGCNVHLIEKEPKLKVLGDTITLTANATKVMENWDGVVPHIASESALPEVVCFRSDKGEVLYNQDWRHKYDGHYTFYTSRARSQNIIYEYAVKVGVKFTFGAKISEFYEDDEKAGVYLNGELIKADFLVGADGVYSEARKYVTGNPDMAQRSGFAIFRAHFPIEHLQKDPLTHELGYSKKDEIIIWIGLDLHAIFIINAKIGHVSAYLTHKDTYTVQESWTYPGTIKDMLACVKDCDPVLEACIKQIPEPSICDFKLLWRDPIHKWVSDKGRVVLVGDAAHPHLPTSGSGGGMAIEDGGTLGAVVDKAGKSNIKMALKAFAKMRFDRTSSTQRMGWEVRHKWHQTDWDLVKKNPEFLKIPQPDWLYAGDAEKYGYEQYDAVVAHLTEGKPFKNTNVPPNFEHDDWSVKSMTELDKQKGSEGLYKLA